MKVPKEVQNYLLTFQECIEDVAQILNLEEEEVIRMFVNTKWDIRECLDWKDVVTVYEAEKKARKEE